MGSVKDLVTTGDNDEPIFPVSYYRHYCYCDQCGSFKLEPWQELKNNIFGWLFRQKILRGVRCAQCQTTYKYGTAFFTNQDENPRKFTIADVPRPLYLNYFTTSPILDDNEKL